MDTKNSCLVNSDFSLYVAHELRTPLTIVRGYAELLPSLPTEMVHEISQKMIASCDRMARIMQSLLALAAIESRPLENLPEIDVIAIIEECKDVLLAAHPEVECHCNFAVSSCMLQGDATLLGIAIANVLENSVAYSKPPATISITLTRTDAEITMSIQDRGIGIPREALPRIFDRFYTVNRKGTGLGLALVKVIVEKHGGVISVQSTPGQGMKFSIVFPRILQ